MDLFIPSLFKNPEEMATSILTQTLKMEPRDEGIILSIHCLRGLYKKPGLISKQFLVSIYVPDKSNLVPNLEVYSGENYVIGSTEKSHSNMYTPDNIPDCWGTAYKYLVHRANGALARKIVLPSRY